MSAYENFLELNRNGKVNKHFLEKEGIQGLEKQETDPHKEEFTDLSSWDTPECIDVEVKLQSVSNLFRSAVLFTLFTKITT